MIDVNLTGPFLCSREFVRASPPRGSVIANVSSVHEVIPWPSFSHYCASKGGMKLFAQTIARELAPRGIRVVTVAPGPSCPDQPRADEDPESAASRRSRAVGALASPGDRAAIACWPAERRSTCVDDAVRDGGMTLIPTSYRTRGERALTSNVAYRAGCCGRLLCWPALPPARDPAAGGVITYHAIPLRRRYQSRAARLPRPLGVLAGCWGPARDRGGWRS